MPSQKTGITVIKYPQLQQLGYNVPEKLYPIFDTAGHISTFHDYDVLRRNFRILVTGEKFWDTYKDWDDDYLMGDWEKYLVSRFNNNGIPTVQLLRSLRYMDIDWVYGAWYCKHKDEELQQRAAPPCPGKIPMRFRQVVTILCESMQCALFGMPMPLKDHSLGDEH